MGFNHCNRVLKIQESIWASNSHNGSSPKSVKVHSLTFFALLGVSDVTPKSSFLPTILQPFALVASPKSRVVTLKFCLTINPNLHDAKHQESKL
jgi:hypothetical protein